MALSIKDCTIMKVVQTIYYQVDVRYVTTRGLQCTCMSLNSVTWTLFGSPGLWDRLDLDFILGKGDQLFKFIGKFRFLGMEDLTQEFLVENSSIT